MRFFRNLYLLYRYDELRSLQHMNRRLIAMLRALNEYHGVEFLFTGTDDKPSFRIIEKERTHKHA